MTSVDDTACEHSEHSRSGTTILVLGLQSTSSAVTSSIVRQLDVVFGFTFQVGSTHFIPCSIPGSIPGYRSLFRYSFNKIRVQRATLLVLLLS